SSSTCCLSAKSSSRFFALGVIFFLFFRVHQSKSWIFRRKLRLGGFNILISDSSSAKIVPHFFEGNSLGLPFRDQLRPFLRAHLGNVKVGVKLVGKLFLGRLQAPKLSGPIQTLVVGARNILRAIR